MPTFQEYKEQIRKSVKELSVNESKKACEDDPKTVIIDVRDTENWEEAHIPGSVNIPRGLLELKIEEHIPDKTTPVICQCGGGTRSLLSAKSLKELGYTNVASMAGGFREWKAAGFPLEKHRGLSTKEKTFYAAHLNIPDVGEAGQNKLRKAKVLLVGVGGLGSPAAYYLAAAGVGTLGIVDFDTVEISNLHRQILHSIETVGQLKTKSAKNRLAALNPNITVNTYPEKLTDQNAKRFFKPYDIIIDGSDNFQTRYLINDTAVSLNKPFVHGSVYRFEGQVSFFNALEGPCYRCLYPEPPSPNEAPSCAEAGVFGALPGVIGLLEAVETIKWILGKGKLLQGKLLCYDALKTEFRKIRFEKAADCRSCKSL